MLGRSRGSNDGSGERRSSDAGRPLESAPNNGDGCPHRPGKVSSRLPMLVHESQQEGPSDDNGHPHLHASSLPLPSTFSVPVVGPFCLLVAFRLPLPRLLLGRLGAVECVVCGTLANDSPVPIPLVSRGDETLRLGLRLRLFLGRILPHGASRSRAGHYVDVSDQSMVFQNSKSRIMRRSITPTTICCKVQTPPPSSSE